MLDTDIVTAKIHFFFKQGFLFMFYSLGLSNEKATISVKKSWLFTNNLFYNPFVQPFVHEGTPAPFPAPIALLFSVYTPLTFTEFPAVSLPVAFVLTLSNLTLVALSSPFETYPTLSSC